MYCALELPGEAKEILARLVVDLSSTVASLIVPTILLYLAIYALVEGKLRTFSVLRLLSSSLFIASTWMVASDCGIVGSLHYFAVAIGVMKGLDLYIRRNSPPKYASKDPPSSLTIALLLLTELRYESFTPNYVPRASVPSHTTTVKAKPTPSGTGISSKYDLNFSEPTNLLIHTLLFLTLQALFLQTNPTIIAIQILLAIYILWSTLQLLLRYPSSPPLFGPIYKATSLATFWSDIWHGAFTSPCRSLAYDPLCDSLRRNLGVPIQLARGAGVIASFFLMAIFHVYGLWPLLPGPALLRIGAFFMLNGVGTVVEEAIWGRRVHWVKTVLAWAYELAVASWTAEGLDIPEGLVGVDLRALCS